MIEGIEYLKEKLKIADLAMVEKRMDKGMHFLMVGMISGNIAKLEHIEDLESEVTRFKEKLHIMETTALTIQSRLQIYEPNFMMLPNP